jgi:hypothetical protein
MRTLELVASGSVRAEMKCSELHQLYFEMKEKVFKNPWLGLACHTSELEAILRRTFGETRMSQKDSPKVLVCAVNKATTHLKLTFFNNCLEDEFSHELVWKVGRYTAAAPIYFTECEGFVDGGLLANNPCSDALTKIQDYHKERGGQLSLVVSVGCGQYPPSSLGNTDILSGWNLFKAPEKLKNLRRLFITALFSSSEAVSENCRCRCEQQSPPIQYFRFNPSLNEAIESTETDGAKLCDLVVNAKQLLENEDLKRDLLVQHFYFTAMQRR